MQNPTGLGGLQDNENGGAALQEMMPDQPTGNNSGSNSGGDEEDEEHEDSAGEGDGGDELEDQIGAIFGFAGADGQNAVFQFGEQLVNSCMGDQVKGWG